VDAFNFVFSLFGLLLGLALAEVLGGLATALESRRKLHVGWLTPLLGLIVALDLISFWSIAWDVRDAIPARYFSLLCGLLVTGIYYLVARLAFPRDRDQWPDYDVYYFAHKRLVLGGIILCNLLATAGEAVLGVDPFTPGFALWSTVLFYGLMLAAFIARGRRANIALLAIIAAMYPTISFAFLIGPGKGG
jgi:hypothetical protein